LSIICFFYILINSTRIYVQWLSIEFCTILLIRIINIKSKNKIVRIIYFIISSISSLLLIVIILINFNQLYIIKSNRINLILIISLSIKIGLFPFCFWIVYIYKISSWNQSFIISTFIKFIPIYFFSSLIFLTPIFIYLIIFNNFFISLYTNLDFSINKLFGCSSIFNSLFFIFIIQLNKKIFIIFFIIYIIIFFIIIFLLEYHNIKNINFRIISSKSYDLFIIILFIYSLFPLFTTFLFKWEFIYLLEFYFRNNIIFFLLISRILIIWNYFILFKFLILKFKYNKNNLLTDKEIINKILISLIIIFFYLFIFLIFNLI
jgi:hypothetical protein